MYVHAIATSALVIASINLAFNAYIFNNPTSLFILPSTLNVSRDSNAILALGTGDGGTYWEDPSVLLTNNIEYFAINDMFDIRVDDVSMLTAEHENGVILHTRVVSVTPQDAGSGSRTDIMSVSEQNVVTSGRAPGSLAFEDTQTSPNRITICAPSQLDASNIVYELPATLPGGGEFLTNTGVDENNATSFQWEVIDLTKIQSHDTVLRTTSDSIIATMFEKELFVVSNDTFNTSIQMHTTSSTVRNSLHVTGVAEFLSTVDVGGHVTSAQLITSSDATIGGDVNVGGASTLTGNVGMTGTLTVTGTSTFGDNTDITGDLTVTGQASMSSDLDVSGDTSISGNADISGNLGVTGDSLISGNANVAGTFSVTGDITMVSNANIGGDIAVAGDGSVTGNLDVSGTLDITGVTTLTDNVVIGGELSTTGQIQASDDIDITGRLCLRENAIYGTNEVCLQARQDEDITSDVSYFLPSSLGTEGQLLTLLSDPTRTAWADPPSSAPNCMTFYYTTRRTSCSANSGGIDHDSAYSYGSLAEIEFSVSSTPSALDGQISCSHYAQESSSVILDNLESTFRCRANAHTTVYATLLDAHPLGNVGCDGNIMPGMPTLVPAESGNTFSAGHGGLITVNIARQRRSGLQYGPMFAHYRWQICDVDTPIFVDLI